MKKRALFIAVYSCLLLSFLCGMAELIAARGERVSESENRMLQGFPKLSAEAVLSGKYMDEMESYLSDAFFFREETAHFTERLMGCFSLPEDGPATGEIDQARLFAPLEPSTEETMTPHTSASDATAVETAVPEPQDESSSTEAGAQALPAELSDVEFYLEDAEGERVVIATYPADQLASFAQILNQYRAALPKDGSVHFAVPPVAAVANNLLYSDKFTDWGSNLEDVLQGAVDEGVYIYDVTDILRPYIGTERLYPVIDHHWQPVSASLVAEEMLRSQGVPPVNYYEYRYYISTFSTPKPFYGDDLKSLSISVDAVQVMEPVSPVEAYMLRRLTERSPGVFVEKERGALLSYLGGLNGPWRLFITGFHTDRRALVIGDSFQLTFIPFLAPYYDQILATDLRDGCFLADPSCVSIREYIETYEIDDIYMLYSTYSPFCGDEVQSRLMKYLG